MKKRVLCLLVTLSSLNAEISYKSLYAKTATITASLTAAGYLFSLLCEDKENAPYVQGIFGALGIAAGAYYYKHWNPESRMYCNQNNFTMVKNSTLLTIILNSMNDSETIVTTALMNNLFIEYIDIRNPFYYAFEDIRMLKKQSEAILNESRQLLRFYSSYAYKNSDYCALLEQYIIETQLMLEVITGALLAIKNTPEYKEALALQIEIEKQESLEKMAYAQQTQAINSFSRPTVIVQK